MAASAALRTGQAENERLTTVLAPTRDRRCRGGGGAAVAPALRRDAYFRRFLSRRGPDRAGSRPGLLTVGPAHLRVGALGLAVLAVLTAKTMSLYDRDQTVIGAKRTLDEAPGLFQLLHSPRPRVLAGAFACCTTQPPTSGRRGRALVGRPLPCAAGHAGPGTAFGTGRRPGQSAASSWPRPRTTGGSTRSWALNSRLKSRIVAHLPLIERRDREQRAAPRCPRALCAHPRHPPGRGGTIDGADAGVVLDVVSRAKELGVNVSVLPRICEVIGSSVRVRRPRRYDAARRPLVPPVAFDSRCSSAPRISSALASC